MSDKTIYKFIFFASAAMFGVSASDFHGWTSALAMLFQVIAAYIISKNL